MSFLRNSRRMDSLATGHGAGSGRETTLIHGFRNYPSNASLGRPGIGHLGYQEGYTQFDRRWLQNANNDSKATQLGLHSVEVDQITHHSTNRSNKSIVEKYTVNSHERQPFDVTHNELIMCRKPINGVPDKNQPLWMLGLSAYNRYLRSPEGLQLYGNNRTSSYITDDWLLLGVMQTAPTTNANNPDPVTSSLGNKTETVTISGVCRIFDVSAWMEDHDKFKYLNSVKAGQTLSLLHNLYEDKKNIPSVTSSRIQQRILVEPQMYWQAVPIRHYGKHIESNFYTYYDFLDPSRNYEGSQQRIASVVNLMEEPTEFDQSSLAKSYLWEERHGKDAYESSRKLRIIEIDFRN